MMLRVSMNMISSEPRANWSSPETGRALDVVLACEDFSTGMHALSIFDKLFPEGGSGGPAGAQSVWKFEFLGITRLRELAAAEAAGADLVIISAHAPGTLTPAVKNWLDLSLEKREGRPGSLVLLLDDAGNDVERTLPVDACLERQAARAGLNFTTHKTAGRHAFDDFHLAVDARKLPAALEALRESVGSWQNTV